MDTIVDYPNFGGVNLPARVSSFVWIFMSRKRKGLGLICVGVWCRLDAVTG